MSDVSVISASSVVRGNLSGNTSLRVDGRVRGDISVSGDIQLGAGAQVAGNLSGAAISIAGTVEGDVSASVVLLLEKGAKVAGNLSAPRIGIAEGALVRGNVQSEGAGGETRTVSLSTGFGARNATSTRVTPNRPVERPAPAVRPQVPAARPAPRDLPRMEPVVEKAAPRKVESGATPQASLNLELERNNAEANKAERRSPPPPVVSAPSRIAKGRKKVAKRS
jgi:cytoskeletal protein CcmA (bactofilin family)